MKKTRWELVEKLSGSGVLFRCGSGESIEIDYKLAVTQEYIITGRGKDIPCQKNINGHVHPFPGRLKSNTVCAWPMVR